MICGKLFNIQIYKKVNICSIIVLLVADPLFSTHLPIIKYIDRGNKPQYTVWCPFDTEESEYVKLIRKEGYKVIASHIDEGKNFFDGKKLLCKHLAEEFSYSPGLLLITFPIFHKRATPRSA